MNEAAGCLCILAVIGILLLVVLIPISFSYIDYYDYGLNQRRTTGSVNIERVYPKGRYFTGPDHKFLKYPADTHFVHIDEMTVFSASSGNNESIGLEFKLDIDFTYQIIEDEVGLLHKELANSYGNVVLSRVKDAMKNEAIYITFNQFFQSRMEVERQLFRAVEKRLDVPPKTHVKLDQFHLGRIKIPAAVANKQLEARVQNERNDMEAYLQEAEIERQKTTVEVNKINLDQDKVLKTSKAEGDLIRAKAVVEADEIKNQAQLKGTKSLVTATGISTQDHKTAFTYLKNLMDRKDSLDIDVSYLSSDNIIKTIDV